MDLIPATAGVEACGRCIVRGERLARVKFVALPVEKAPGDLLREAGTPGGLGKSIRQFAFRVIGRLVAARP